MAKQKLTEREQGIRHFQKNPNRRAPFRHWGYKTGCEYFYVQNRTDSKNFDEWRIDYRSERMIFNFINYPMSNSQKLMNLIIPNPHFKVDLLGCIAKGDLYFTRNLDHNHYQIATNLYGPHENYWFQERNGEWSSDLRINNKTIHRCTNYDTWNTKKYRLLNLIPPL